MSSWRRNRALFDSLRPRRETEKRSLRSLRYRNGISAISLETLSSVTQGKQRNAIVVTQTIPLARIVLSIGEAYSWNKWISPSITRNASIAGILFFFFSSSYPQIGTLIYSLNSPLSYSGCIVLIVFNNSRPIKIHSCRLYREGGDPLTPTCVTSTHHLIYLSKTD